MWEIVLIIIFALFWLLPNALVLYDKLNGTHASCRFYEWHDGEGDSPRFNSCNINSVCSKCGADVTRDSNGNWF